MTVSATAPVCYQLISPKSPEYASPAMKLCQPLREPVESRHSDGPSVRPQIPIELSQRGRQRCNRSAKLIFLPLSSSRPQVERPTGSRATCQFGWICCGSR